METDPKPVEELCVRIERAWFDDRDPSVVNQLAAQYPNHAQDLYGFFGSLIWGEEAPVGADEQTQRIAENIEDWLQKEGFSLATEAARAERSKVATQPTPATAKDDARQQTFVAFIQQETGQSLDSIAEVMGDVTVSFLVYTSRTPTLVPEPVHLELASRFYHLWHIPVDAVLETLQKTPHIRWAASRTQPLSPGPGTFEEILANSELTDPQQQYWLQVAGR